MSIGIPQLENRINSATLRGNLKGVVDTVKALQVGIAEVKDKPERLDTYNALNTNLKGALEWGKNLQERIRIHESGFTPNR